jgi:putative flavoprotein involved in K+ transport
MGSAAIATPVQQVNEWLSAFGSALDRADFDTAIEMFEDDAFWRQLTAHPKALLRCHRVSFTPDRRALCGKPSIKAMLESTVNAAKPGGWQVDGAATESDGIVDAWFTFETAVSEGVGHIRLEAGKCWILSTVTATDGVCC